MARATNKPDLFSDSGKSISASNPLNAKPLETRLASPKRLVLPVNLAGSLKHLDNDQLDELLRAVTEEMRSRKLPLSQRSNPASQSAVREKSPRRRPKVSSGAIPSGQANLIRAAFKAGLKPAAISRELGIPQSVVQGVLARR